ncbi:hypothetical protein [Bradyrhizobium prioriisuperbiae]|uniref:hypothetical protein n=1 Tax=Bradyrhizobium prioriisuperbiae TaxID=2854389 RepID=UPI0028E49DA1|nr:hypothetical protein [Bradyrhizobium prioritasuperba]
MGREKITINQNDFPAWGKLVKSWATGMNYVDHEMTEADPVPSTQEIPPKWPRPTSFVEFWEQCRKARVGLIYDDGLNTPVPRDAGLGLAVTQGDGDVFVLRLPPRDILVTHEARILAGALYRLPTFYQRIFGAPIDPAQQDTKVKKMTLHAERIGDYTLSTCA